MRITEKEAKYVAKRRGKDTRTFHSWVNIVYIEPPPAPPGDDTDLRVFVNNMRGWNDKQ